MRAFEDIYLATRRLLERKEEIHRLIAQEGVMSEAIEIGEMLPLHICNRYYLLTLRTLKIIFYPKDDLLSNERNDSYL